MKNPYIIGVTGGSGSGKTRFIDELIIDFSDNQVCFVSQDNYYRSRDQQPKDDHGIRNFDIPESINLAKFVSDVNKLINGEKVILEEYTYNNPNATKKKIILQSAPVIILEGIFILYHEDLRDLIDLKVFVHAMEHIMLSRRIKRDEEERGYDLEDVLYRYRYHVMPSFRKYILPYKEDCDIIINNNDNYVKAQQVLRSYIHEIIRMG